MPHDKHGRPLKPGDRVAIPCVIKQVQSSADRFDCTLETEEPMYPGGARTTLVLNASQILLATDQTAKADEPPPDAPPGSGD